MKHIAKALASTGRNGDTALLHVTQPELQALNRLSQSAGLGSLPHNPVTGLPEASLLGTILPIVGAVAGTFMGGQTAAGAEVGGALGGALGGYAGSRVDHTNPYLGTILGGVGGYAAGASGLGAPSAPTQAGAPLTDAAINAETANAATNSLLDAGANQGVGSFATDQGAQSAGQTGIATAAPATSATPEQFSASIDRTNPWTGQAAPQQLPEGGMAATGPGYNYTDRMPPLSTTATTASEPPSGVASWISKHPMETYVLGSAGVRALSPQRASGQQMHSVNFAGASKNQRQYTGAPTKVGGEPNYFTGNSLYNYAQAPGTTVQRYADGGPVAPKYTMSAPTQNAVQYNASNNAPMAAAPDLRAAPLAAQTIPYGNGQSYTLPAPTDPNWYATAAANAPTAVDLKAKETAAAAQAATQANTPATSYFTYQQWQESNPFTPMSYEEWRAQQSSTPNLNAYTPPPQYARGGLASLPPAMVRGQGDGMSDSVPAAIDGGRGKKEEIRVADGEYIVPADVVAHLGNGSSDAGAKHLDKTMAKIRKARTGNPKQGKQIKPEKFL